MPIRCSALKVLLPDYLDGKLNQRKKKLADQHLRKCPSCRQALALQQEWLRCRQNLLRESPELPPDLQDRIIAAIRAEASNKTYAPSYWKNWQKSLPRMAALAATVVLLFAVTYIFSGAMQRVNNEKTSFGDGLTQAGASDLKTPGEVASQGTEKGAVGFDSAWQISNGQVPEAAEILSACRNSFEASQVDDECISFLNTATDLKYLTRSGDPKQTVILSAYPSDVIADQAKLIKESFSSCTTPVKIEIIRADELPMRLNSLEPGLYERVFAKEPAASSWIFILIGE